VGRRRRVSGALLAAAAVIAPAAMLLGASAARPAGPVVALAPDGERVELVAGHAGVGDLAAALDRAGLPGVLVRDGSSWLLASTLVVRDGARLTVDGGELRLRSEPGTVVGLEAAGGAIDLTGGAVVTSWDPVAGGPDAQPADGRAWVLATGGALLRVDHATVRMLGYDAPGRSGLTWDAARGEVVGSTVTGNWHGLSALRTAPLLVRDAVIERSEHDGVRGRACSARGSARGSAPGAAPGARGGLVVERAVVRDNGGDGVAVGAGCGGSVVRDSRAQRNAGDGIAVRAGAGGAVVERNEAEGNGGAGIGVGRSSGTRVAGNLAYGNAAGIAVRDRAAAVVVDGNRLTANRGDGLRVTGGAAVAAARGNVADGNHRAGAYVDGAAATLGPGNELVGNDVGVWATATARRVRLTGNRVDGNALDLRIEGSSGGGEAGPDA